VPKYKVAVDLDVEADTSDSAGAKVKEALSNFDNVEVSDVDELEDDVVEEEEE
jgi:hypothetical protein